MLEDKIKQFEDEKVKYEERKKEEERHLSA